MLTENYPGAFKQLSNKLEKEVLKWAKSAPPDGEKTALKKKPDKE